MGLFSKKKGPEVVDLSNLKERGTLQRALELSQKEIQKDFDDERFVDLGSSDVPKESNKSSDEESALGFLENFANIGASESRVLDKEREINALKLKIEDIEYKLDRFMEKIDKLEEKLKNVNS